MVTKAETDEVINAERCGADTGADTGRFESSVVGTAGNMTKSSNQFRGTVEGGMALKEVGEKVEATRFQISSGMNSRGRGDKNIDRVGGATDGEGYKSSGQTSGSSR
jgi:hypothetical protein